MATATDNTALFRRLDTYPWHQDEEFQGGLRAILGSVPDPQQAEHLTLRAKCYYFARKDGQPVDFNGYKHWVESHRQGGNAVQDTVNGDALNSHVDTEEEQSSGGMGEAPKPASFAEICELIAKGKPIPGIKDIPDTILEGQASESQTEKRKKPWEKDSEANTPSWMA